MTDTEPNTPETDMRSIMLEIERVRRPSPALARLSMAWQAARAVIFVAVFMHAYRNPHSDLAYIFAGYLTGDFTVMLLTSFHHVLKHPAAALFDIGALAGLIVLLMGVGTFDDLGIEGLGMGGAFLGYFATVVVKFGWHGLVQILAEDH